MIIGYVLAPIWRTGRLLSERISDLHSNAASVPMTGETIRKLVSRSPEEGDGEYYRTGMCPAIHYRGH
jgi:hypothetical protein